MNKFSVGDLILIGGDWYLLAQVDFNVVTLIGLKSANRWEAGLKVKEISNISAEEMSLILRREFDLLRRRIPAEEVPNINNLITEAIKVAEWIQMK